MELRSYKTNKYEITKELRKKLKIFEENNSNMTRKERCIHIKKMFKIILTNASWARRNKEFYDTVKDKFLEFSMYKEFIEIHSDKQLKTYINFFDLSQSVQEMKRPFETSSSDESSSSDREDREDSEDSEDREEEDREDREEEQPFQLPQVLGVRRVYGMNSNERQTLQDFQREAEEYFEREMEQHFLESNFTSNSWVDWTHEQIMRDQDEQILREEPRHEQELNYQRPINTLFSFQYTSPLISQTIPNPIQENISGRDIVPGNFTPRVSQTLQSAIHPEVDDNKAEEDEKKCIVCQDNKPCVINTRCGHYICCGSCSSNIFSSKNNKCPMCREKWDSIIKVFQ